MKIFFKKLGKGLLDTLYIFLSVGTLISIGYAIIYLMTETYIGIPLVILLFTIYSVWDSGFRVK